MTLVASSISRGVLTVTLDSPQNRNAISLALVEELDAALARIDEDPDLRAVLLTHTGPTFCAGADLKESPANLPARGARLIDVLDRLATCPLPVVVAMKGNVRAGGIGLLGAADIVIAPSDATFAFTEVRIGVVPAIIGVTVVPRMSPRSVQRYFLTGETFDAAEAVENGLVTMSVPLAEVDARTEAILETFRLAAPSALRATKELVRSRTNRAADRDGLVAAAEVSARAFLSDDGQEGMRAFREKRAPRWVR